MELEQIKQKILEILSKGEHTKQQLADTLWVKYRKVSLAIEELISEGKVFKSANGYTTIPQPKPQRRTKKTPPVAKKYSETKILRIVFTLISIGTTIMSVRNTSVYLASVFPAPFYTLMAILMSLFMISAFSTAVFLWSHRQKGTAVVVISLWFLCTVYSMSATVIGIYDMQKDLFRNSSVATKTSTAQSDIIAEYDRQIKSIEAGIQDKRNTLNRINGNIVWYDTPEKKIENKATYNNLVWAIASAEKFIKDETNKSLLIAEKKSLALTKSAETVNILTVAPSFYEQMEKLFGVAAGLVQFILGCFAGIFIDAIAPVAVSLALFLKEKEV